MGRYAAADAPIAMSKPKRVMSVLRSMSRAALRPPSPEPGKKKPEVHSEAEQMHETELMLPEHILQAATLVLQSQDALMDAIIQLGAKQGSMPADLAEAIAAPAR